MAGNKRKGGRVVLTASAASAINSSGLFVEAFLHHGRVANHPQVPAHAPLLQDNYNWNLGGISTNRKRRLPDAHIFSCDTSCFSSINSDNTANTEVDVEMEPPDNEEEYNDDMDDIIDLYPDDDVSLFNDEELFHKDHDEGHLSASCLSNVFGDLKLAVPPSTAEQPDIAYFYLKNKIGLSDEAMWKVTFEAGNALGLTAKTLDWKISVLRRNMKLSDDDIREIITKYPAILQRSADKKLAPTILLLVRALDLSKAELRSMVVKYPCIMGYSSKNLLSKVDFFTETLGFTVDETRKLVVQEPRLMCAAVRTGMLPRFGFLLKEMAIPIEDIRTIVKKNPLVLLYSIEHNLKEKLISFLVMRLRMESHHVCKVLKVFPQLLDYNLEDTILPIAQYFLNELDFAPTELRSIMIKHPRLMSSSLRKIKHVVGFFRFEFNLEPAQVKRLIYQAPQSFGLSDDNLRSKITYFRKFFQLDTDEVRKVVVGMPTLILCSIETNLGPKAEYLLEAFDNDILALKAAILRQPTLMGYSLEKRIKPRMNSLKEIGADPRSITVGVSMTNDNFRKWVDEKAIKILENGGTEPAPYTQRKVRSQTSSSAIVLAEGSENEKLLGKDQGDDTSDRSSRIVHWKR